MQARDEMALIKQFLLHLVEDWLAHPNRTARDLASKSGVSAGWLSSMRAGEEMGEEKTFDLLDFFGMGLVEALAKATAWSKARPKSRALRVESEHLLSAIQLLRDGGIDVSSAMRRVATGVLEREGDKSTALWVRTLSVLAEVERAGGLGQRVDREDHTARKATVTRRGQRRVSFDPVRSRDGT
jgi:hypothetical protein